MRIAYIAEYQGKDLIQQRNIKNHLSLAQSLKIRLIAKMLYNGGYEVEIISQGVVIENQWKYFKAICESERFHPNIPIFYSSAMDFRFFRGLSANLSTLAIFKRRHNERPYDLVIIYNLKGPQVKCAKYILNNLKIPIILEYEDDSFVTITGKTSSRRNLFKNKGFHIIKNLSGCFAASPHLLQQIPTEIPKFLLRGIISEDLIEKAKLKRNAKKNWVLFSGTHDPSKGIEKLVIAWKYLNIEGWELHITGGGKLTEKIREMANNDSTIIIHGMVSREKLIKLLVAAKICINPHEVSNTPGNVFAFKIIEYLASGAHVITTPMGQLEKEIEKGITYISDNQPITISNTLNSVISNERFINSSMEYVHRIYRQDAVLKLLINHINNVKIYNKGKRA